MVFRFPGQFNKTEVTNNVTERPWITLLITDSSKVLLNSGSL